MPHRKAPFVHMARSSEQQTNAQAQAATGGVLSRLRERLSGDVSVSADTDLTASAEDLWSNDR
jgi:uncharacterized protein (DUF2267 family)